MKYYVIKAMCAEFVRIIVRASPPAGHLSEVMAGGGDFGGGPVQRRFHTFLLLVVTLYADGSGGGDVPRSTVVIKVPRFAYFRYTLSLSLQV